MEGSKKRAEKDKIIQAQDEWEPVGHTPMPHVSDLRNWDRRLLATYQPFYAPFCDLCCLCAQDTVDETDSTAPLGRFSRARGQVCTGRKDRLVPGKDATQQARVVLQFIHRLVNTGGDLAV